MTVDYKLIGARIKTLRRANSITQEQLAEKLSVTVGYISQIERGITKPNLEMLSEIGTVLDCDVSYFISGAQIAGTHYLEDELAGKFAKLDGKNKSMLLEITDILLKHTDD